MADRSMSVPMTLCDLERRNPSGQIFQADLIIIIIIITTTIFIVLSS